MLLIATPPRKLSVFGQTEGLVPIPGTLCYVIQVDYLVRLNTHPNELSYPDKKWLVGVSLGFVKSPSDYVSQEILLANKPAGSSSRLISVGPESPLVLPESVFLAWKRDLPSPKTGRLIKETILQYFANIADRNNYLKVVTEMSAFRDKHIRICQPSSRKKLPVVPEMEESFFVLGKYLKTEKQVEGARLNYRRALQIAELQDRK